MRICEIWMIILGLKQAVVKETLKFKKSYSTPSSSVKEVLQLNLRNIAGLLEENIPSKSRTSINYCFALLDPL